MSKGALDRSISYYNVVTSHFTVYLLEAGKVFETSKESSGHN